MSNIQPKPWGVIAGSFVVGVISLAISIYGVANGLLFVGHGRRNSEGSIAVGFLGIIGAFALFAAIKGVQSAPPSTPSEPKGGWTWGTAAFAIGAVLFWSGLIAFVLWKSKGDG